MDEKYQLIADLRSLPATVEEVDYQKRGYHLEVQLAVEQVRSFAGLLLEKEFYLSFASAVHTSPVIEILYQFACFAMPCRIVARAPLAADGTMPTICDIFDGANWHERETRDMFGVIFTGHPYLEPLLLPEEDADLRPLLKREEEVKAAGEIRPLATAPEQEEKE
jgi:NADH-quinone oxidoreductase subunit C